MAKAAPGDAMSDAAFEHFEEYLRMAPVVDVAASGLGGAHAQSSFRLILEGAVSVLAKPENAPGVHDGPAMVRREAAAWLIARELGWTDLVATTVIREIDDPLSGGSTTASLQVLWADCVPAFDCQVPSERWRAGVFDALVLHADRHPGNWLGVPGSRLGDARLRLIDHGYAFGSGALNSPFCLEFAGQPIPTDLMAAIADLLRRQRMLEALLGDVLDPAARNGLLDRAINLRTSGTLNVKP